MDLVERVKAIILTPRAEWPAIERETSTASSLYLEYVAILAAIPEIAHFIGHSLIGAARAPMLSGLLRALVVYLVSLAAVYLIAIGINLLAPRFGGRRNFSNALKLSVYSHTPLWLAGIFLLVPGLNFLTILGLYGIYLLWVGLPVLMRTPHAKALPFASLIAGLAFIPAVVLSIV